MFKKIVLLLCFPFLCCCTEGKELKEVLKRGKTGEFVVAQHQKNYTLWHIKELKDSSLLLEEINVPIKRLKLPENGWQGWIDGNAQNHIGWVMYTINLESGKVTGIYSVDQGCWLAEEIPNRFLSTLLNVPFYPVSPQERRKLGNGEPWNPPLFFEAHEAHGVFDQYVTRWPTDGSELSNKKVEIYLLESDKYPSFFPYWLQLCGSFGKVSVRIVDTGAQLSTFTRSMWKLSTP